MAKKDIKSEKKEQEKAQKLEEKIDKLIGKIEQEKNPLKRHFLSLRVKMITSKIQREIDIQNIREEYADKKDYILKRKEKRDDKYFDKVASLTNEINALKRELMADEEYDIDSDYFVYPDRYIEKAGGLKNFAEKLKESKNPDTRYAGKKIESVERKKKRLDKLYSELNREENKWDKNESEYKRNNRILNRRETSLIVARKLNIFSRIGNFFKNMSEEIKAYREDKAEIKDLKNAQIEDMEILDEEYEKRMQELREEYESQKKILKEEHKAELNEKNEELGRSTAESFRKKYEVPATYVQEEEEEKDEDTNYRRKLIEEGILEPQSNSGDDRG